MGLGAPPGAETLPNCGPKDRLLNAEVSSKSGQWRPDSWQKSTSRNLHLLNPHMGSPEKLRKHKGSLSVRILYTFSRATVGGIGSEIGGWPVAPRCLPLSPVVARLPLSPAVSRSLPLFPVGSPVVSRCRPSPVVSRFLPLPPAVSHCLASSPVSIFVFSNFQTSIFQFSNFKFSTHTKVSNFADAHVKYDDRNLV